MEIGFIWNHHWYWLLDWSAGVTDIRAQLLISTTSTITVFRWSCNESDSLWFNNVLWFQWRRQISPVVSISELEGYWKVDRLLAGQTAQQKGTTAWWYSNKISLPNLHLLLISWQNVSRQAGRLYLHPYTDKGQTYSLNEASDWLNKY